MSLRWRLVLTTIGLTVPLWLAASVGFQTMRLEQLDGVMAAVALATIPDGLTAVCEPGLRSHPTAPFPRGRGGLLFTNGDDLPVHVVSLDVEGAGTDSGVAAPSVTQLDAAIQHDFVGWSVDDSERPMRYVLVALPGRTDRCVFALATAPLRLPSMAPLPVLLWPVLICGLAILVGLAPVVRRARRLTQAVERWRNAEIPDIPSDSTSDEIGELARAFHDAVAAVEARERSLREFVENTTHDLATPLTALQGHLSALERGAGPTVARQANSEAQFLSGLLANLALTAKLDADQQVELDVDLGAVVSRVRDRYRVMASRSGLEFEAVWPDDPIVVSGDITLIEQALNNLVDNALRYNREAGHVAVVLDHDGDGFVLRVMDDGPGMSDEERERLVRRNERGDAARSRSPHGRGLGLTIVSRVASVHGWTLSLTRTEPQGLTAELRGTMFTA